MQTKGYKTRYIEYYLNMFTHFFSCTWQLIILIPATLAFFL